MKLQNLTYVLIGILGIGLLPRAQAVVPPPDGGYSNLTTAEGTNALQNLTTGAANTGVGWRALFSAGAGNYNTGVGAGALVLNTGDSNTALGTAALLLNTTAGQNTAVGTGALLFNDTGASNTAVGVNALASNDSGNSNTAVGVSALPVNVSGIENTAVGGAALFSNVDGSHNIAVGQAALSNNTAGSNNIAVGEFAGLSVTTSNNVIAIGVQGQDISNSCFIGNIFNAMAPSGSAVFIDANNRLGTNTSSKRFKDEIKSMDKASDAIFALRPVTFRYKKDIDPAGKSQFGLVAEEVEKVNPDLVVRDKEGKPYSVRYEQVNAMLLNEFLKEHRTVQELKSVVTKQEVAAAQQQKQIEALTASLQKVSALVEASKHGAQMVNNP